MTAAAAIFLLSGCTKLDDSLPDSYYQTDIVTDAPVSSETAASSVTVPSASETTVSDVQITETSVSESAEALPAETTVPHETEVTGSESGFSETETSYSESETTQSETASETTVITTAAETVLSGETTAAPQVTVVTIPTLHTGTEASVTSAETAVTEETAPAYYPQSGYYTLNFDRQKAVWISYLEFERIMKNASEAEFTEALGKCFDNIAALGCNTVYFQVRAYGDAYYSSSLFPEGDRLTGDYDPLKIAVRAAHDRGLSIHAWINPMRLMTDSQMKNISESYAIGRWYNDSRTNGTYMVNSAGRWYLNPAYDETVDLICDGISEIVTGYDVDGIQIDDYFYPTTDASFDSAAYEASGTALGLADWRRENVTSMVKKMYSAVHDANPTAVFGISPQGNINSNVNELYADVYTWLSEPGCCDYICPQIYYGFDNGALPYAETTDTWAKLIKRSDISLVIGLAAYKSGLEDKYAGSGKYEWQENTDILVRQRDLTDIYGAGYAYFRYDSLFIPEPSVAASVSAELENLK